MDEFQNADPEPSPGALVPAFDVTVATVSVVDGMWQDQPDNVAAFIEARLGELARGRGNLYLCLDVSGEVEGRAEVERALIEVIRDTFASGRGSISFALSEALRAANAYLFEANRQVAREMRRMAGISAVVLRGNDLYVAQAGPAVVYVEANERLARFPAESDWFVEDAPLIAPQGAASAPLGIRREFASDLAHTSVGVSDVFVLATRALTQLASTQELAVTFTERTAQEIAGHIEELGEDSDLTALIAELMDPHAPIVTDGEVSDITRDSATPAEHIESLPVPLASLVSLDETEPPLESDESESFEQEQEDEPEPAWESAVPAGALDTDQELDWEDEEQADFEPADQQPGAAQPQADDKRQPVFTSAAAAAIPLLRQPQHPTTLPPPPPVPRTPSENPDRAPAQAQPAPEDWDAELEQRRAERAARRAQQKEDVGRAVGSTTGAIAAIVAAISGFFSSAFGAVDWDGAGKAINRFLNLGVGALISFFLLLVRLVLPGAAPRSTALIPRRATSDPLWLKAMALVLPVIFIALAGGAYLNRQTAVNAQYESMIAQADTIVKQAEVNPDKVQAREQLNEALKIIQDTQAIRDTTKARGVLYRIQDQLNEIDGVAVLYFLPTIAQVNGAQFKQIATSDQDVFLLDGRGSILKYIVNDASGAVEDGTSDNVLLKTGDTVGDQAIKALQLITIASPAQDKATLVAAADNSILVYDLEAAQWSASPVEDAENWTDLRALDSFGGNIYLLDGKNNQIYRYTPTATGYTSEGTPYFPTNAQPVLNKAVDMAIDGDIWVLNDNGQVLRFRGGVTVPFELGALATPLKDPVAIYTRMGVDSLYIADAGNQRIIEFDKTGKFVRQFKPFAEKGDVFENLRDFTVNETKGKLYFANPDAAYMANVSQ
ncbi:MAG: hypothetical protein IT331_12230 [Anaerolineae bacterium]|nr:hypothetical protein [Anaerolineae bacterium]